jgi:hypothetical protein
LRRLGIMIALAAALFGFIQDEPSVIVVSEDAFSIGSPRVVVEGKLGASAWSPVGSAVLFTAEVSTESATEESTRLARGDVGEPVLESRAFVYFQDTAKLVRLGQEWRTKGYVLRSLNWVDPRTVLIVASDSSGEQPFIVMLYDAMSGQLVRRIGATRAIAKSVSTPTGAILVTIDPSINPARFFFRSLERSGLGAEQELGDSVVGGVPTDTGGSLWLIDGRHFELRVSAGRLIKNEVSEEAARQITTANDKTRVRFVRSADPRDGMVFTAVGTPHSEFLRSSVTIGRATMVRNTEQPLGHGVVYELDGVVLSRIVVPLDPVAKKRALDRHEQWALTQWATEVWNEYQSWANGFSDPPSSEAFPYLRIESLEPIVDRINWEASGTTLFSIRGRAFEIQVAPDGKRQTKRLTGPIGARNPLLPTVAAR